MNEGQAKPPQVGAALHEAVAAIYFADNSDYETALWGVVRRLAPDVAELLENDTRAAYDRTKWWAEADESDDAPVVAKTAFDSSAWLALLARWLEIERELRDEETKALTRGDTKDADQWRAQWCGLKPRINDLAEEIGRASKANGGSERSAPASENVKDKP